MVCGPPSGTSPSPLGCPRGNDANVSVMDTRGLVLPSFRLLRAKVQRTLQYRQTCSGGPKRGITVSKTARLCVCPQGKTLLPAPKIKACAAFRTLTQPPGRVPEPPHFLPSVPRTGLTRHHPASAAHRLCPLPFIFPKTQENK